MILLDTNVLSETLRPSSESRVTRWLDSQTFETLHLSAITVAELRFGVLIMPPGRKRDALLDNLERRILPAFAGRVVPFDVDASRAYASLMSMARARGVVIGLADGYIAATAAARDMIIATRDTGPFKAAGLSVIDPWTVAA